MRWLFLAVLLATPVSDPSLELTGIAHVAFRVAEVQKSREFFERLGFEQAFEFADPGKPPVAYIKINDRQFVELYQRADASQPVALLHVCYEASDLQALRKEYLKRGLDPAEARKFRAGNLLFTLHDPEGQLLEYTQYMPGSLHFEDRGKHLGARRVSDHLLRAVNSVRNVQAEAAFYTAKLGFRDMGLEAASAVRLQIPGNSGEEVDLDPADRARQPQLVFAVQDLRRTANELRGRGLAVGSIDHGVSVTEPAGIAIVFTEVPGKPQASH